MGKRRKRVGRRLVVDTDVVCSASEVDAGGRGGSSLRVLRCILEHAHLWVLTPRIRAEFHRRRSRVATRWLREMYGRKQVHAVDDGADEELELAGPVLRTISEGHTRQRAAAEKDVHLVEAALVTDQAVISYDEKVRRLFAAAASTLSQLGPVLWSNPERPEEEVLPWLENGAPDEEHRRLGRDPRAEWDADA